jgi:hypothetical protein
MAIISKDQQLENKFTKNEIDFLLRHIAASTFDGKDVIILSSIVNKLQNQNT